LRTCTIHVDDEVNCRIGGLHPEHLELLWNKFGIYVDGYFHMPAYQLRRWDGKIRFFDKNGKTYTKLLDEIIPYLAAWDYDVNINDKRIAAPPLTDKVTADFFGLANEEDPAERFELRPYQVDVINALLEAGSGFAICATGSGKTSMCAALAAIFYAYKIQTIIIVPSSDLVDQTAEEFRQKYKYFDIPVGVYSGSEKDIDQPIVVATWQSLQNAPHYMSFFQAVIVDEAHGAKAEVIKSLLNDHGKNIVYRYGCTGTMPKPEADQYSLKASIGQVIREVSAAYLIKEGYLSSIEIKPIEMQDESEEMPDYSSEKAFLSRHEDRLADQAQLIMEAQAQYGNTMVLVNSIPQGQALAELIPNATFLFGESAKDLRKVNYKQYAERDDVILIASSGIASTGISIDRIFCLVLIDTGKSFVRCIQSVGRGLRKKGDKNHLVVIDVHSRMKFSRKHFRERKKYYTQAEYPVATTLKRKYSVGRINRGVLFE
jgi:superfamily II DNA or RNA helicase